MLPTKDALRHHVDCMTDEEAEAWVAAMDALARGDGPAFDATCDRLRDWLGPDDADDPVVTGP